MASNIRDRISKNIRRLRIKSGLSQKKLAAEMKVSLRYLSRLENKPQNVTIETLEKVCNAVNCDLHDLICGPQGHNRTARDTKAQIEGVIRYLQSVKVQL